ncbi:MAG: phosphonate metabolism transcriptional regulator PhnF [Burkholderiaceae bacterium]
MRDATIDLDESRPVWLRIADVLADELAAGDPPAGERLPSEQALAERFGVNRHTLRRATRHLADLGYVQIRAGAGLYARRLVLDYALRRRTRLSQNLAENGEVARRELLDAPIEPAGAWAAALGLVPRAEVQVLRTRSLVRGKPIALSRGVFPLPRFAGIADRFVTLRSIADALQTYGVHDYHRRRSVVSCRLPSADEVDWLLRPATLPVMVVEFVNVDGDGRVVEAGATVFAADAVQLTVDHDALKI